VAAEWACRLEVQLVEKQNALPLMNGIWLQKTLSLVTDGTAQGEKGVVKFRGSAFFTHVTAFFWAKKTKGVPQIRAREIERRN
jgi:hypothetical protein